MHLQQRQHSADCEMHEINKTLNWMQHFNTIPIGKARNGLASFDSLLLHSMYVGVCVCVTFSRTIVIIWAFDEFMTFNYFA